MKLVISIGGILILTFVGLLIAKLAGWITVGWLIVFFPLYLPLAILIAITLVLLFLVPIGMIVWIFWLIFYR